ncbi:MAG: ABC transporter ATP-binding protein [Spirochaetales bacterium]
MKKYIISLHDVSRVYVMGDTEVRALRGVSFNIEQGEFVSIMGPSGSGKSTCMNMIGCLDTPSSGDVIINERKTGELNEKELAVLRNETVGFVFQQYHLLSTMTVLENVMLPLRYQGLEFSERKKRAQAVLEQVGLADRMSHRPTELSGGQKQRTAIARALASRPHIILADEPTGALDSETGKSVMNLFSDINLAGTTIVLVTHDIGVAHSANRCIHLLDGQIKSDEITDKSLATHINEKIPAKQKREETHV